MVEVATALTLYMSVYRSIQSKMRSQAFDEESPPTSLVSIYLRMHNTYPILVLLFVSDEEEAVKAHTRLIKF